MSDRRYVDSGGVPRAIPLKGRSRSFAALVAEFAGDVPPRAVLEELRRLGAVRTVAGTRNLIRLRRGSTRSAGKSVYELIEALLDGLELTAESRKAEPRSYMHRVALHARDSLELKTFKERANSGANVFLEGLERSLGAPVGSRRRPKAVKNELTIAIVVREKSSKRNAMP